MPNESVFQSVKDLHNRRNSILGDRVNSFDRQPGPQPGGTGNRRTDHPPRVGILLFGVCLATLALVACHFTDFSVNNRQLQGAAHRAT